MIPVVLMCKTDTQGCFITFRARAKMLEMAAESLAQADDAYAADP
jgi:hypothetical protein